ncbi:putative sulfate exporter family transporter [Salinadaptatus halalkaliphilus]|uniref:Putative sulfate exporter family transporter n=1 Tax=Salinadaptatus halalkaliphilus TaxID=2419781 RepID=A0A4S3TPH9_9EURY|nr:putative sulfate exporter family transporter [Salinadaptatus halalkaliphilus]THE66269.1 putative sulfate exporter family transporter [Salinadaptatus halalkaliphilus]
MGLTRLLPGLVVLCLGAVLARATAVGVGLNHLLVAIALGFVLTNGLGVPDRLEPGIATHKLWLGAGIVLMGASLTLETILEVGGLVLVVVVAVAGATILVVELLSRTVFDLGERLGSLLAAGAGICGVSAVVAVAGAIRAREDHIAYAAATVLLFDAITIVVYPIVGDVLDLSALVFGVWAGVSMFSTGPVVAVGFAHSEGAGQWATMTKLARNALIGVVVLVYASYYARGATGGRLSVRTLWDEFPKFILGFLVLVGIGSLGVLSPAQQAGIENAYNWLFVLAFVGLGTEIKLAELRNTGITPAVVVLLSLLLASILSLAVLTALF